MSEQLPAPVKAVCRVAGVSGGRRRSSAAAVALIYLCAGGITIPLPLTTKS